ncbi:MAG: efflux RND transporter periplasmic adaptor subunit [Proteobacteria bacterium]|nr:efflux RND transporter periplasmic adaptor subunit [Pseudomonadota bacterium]
MMAFRKWIIEKTPSLFSLFIAMGIGFVAGALLFADGSATDNKSTHVAADESAKEELFWSCSMCPQVRQSEPGKCPICGMDLIPVSSVDSATGLSAKQVVLSDRAKVLAKIRTVLVRRRDEPGVNMSLLGRIEPKESTYRVVTAWTSGRIDKLHVNVTGQRIRKGQVIATLYSPEIFGAHQDLIIAKRQLEMLAGGTASSQDAAGSALASIRDRLRLLGIPESDVSRMEKADSPWQQVPIRSQFSGTVLERVATQGAYVQTGAPLYRVADLSSVWVQLDAYESDLPRLALKQKVALKVEAFPDEIFEGKVGFIDPTLDPVRRTARVRVEVRNKKGKLRPGMFTKATVHGGKGSTDDQERPLLVPKSAPIFTGRRSLVYVEVPDANAPTYEARVVRLGPLSNDTYPVIAGLGSGERVVINGAFVLDADLQIRGGNSMMTAPDDRQATKWDDRTDPVTTAGAPPGHGGHSH